MFRTATTKLSIARLATALFRWAWDSNYAPLMWPCHLQLLTQLPLMSSPKQIRQPDFVAHLKLVWHSMLIMLLLVLGIWFLQNVMELLANMLDVLNEDVFLICFALDMSRICLSSCKWHGHINETQWLESQAHLKRVMANQVVESLIIAVLNIGEALIPCAWMI